MRLILNVIFGLSLRKYIEFLLGSILGAGKGYVEGEIFFLALGDKNGVS